MPYKNKKVFVPQNMPKMVALIKIFVFFLSLIFPCYSQCSPGCGKQNLAADPVEKLLCSEAITDVNNQVLAQQK